jgi:uncharacterized membrane protein
VTAPDAAPAVGAAAPGGPAAAARAVVLGLVALLSAVLVAWHVARFRPATAALVLALALLPWLAPLRGLVRGERRTYAATTLLTLPYLAYGLTETLANPGARAYAGATVFVSFALFVALVAYLRVSRPAARAPT